MLDYADFVALFDVIRLRIRRARSALGLSQEEVAGRVGIDVRAIQRYEARVTDVRDPRLKTLYTIAIALGIDLDYLIRQPSADELRELEEAE